ncbi:peptidase M48 [Undibacterium sp. YM2]|uniref:M48 family metallopeptidase n=1 Tax=Undibacterium sp. YM2 TaxID=2058625 RepID=UPI001331D0CE|nr:M48 family metallopeptidase [Undibacterium sp. YM2]BBB68766.1 peptidase M48 [Undibacterium sp. YM2]
MIKANYFDHQQSRIQPIQLDLQQDIVNVIFDGKQYPVRKKRLQVSEPFEHAPCILSFSDGSHCEIHDRADQQTLLDFLDYRPSLVQRWQRQWKWALAAIIVMAALLLAAREWGVPLLADKIAARLPGKYEQALGDEVMKLLDKSVLSRSHLSDQRIAQAKEAIERVMPEHGRIPMRLEIRNAPDIGANAFALPGGTIVVTDAMIEMLSTNKDRGLSPAGAEELAGVLAHEIGHVEGNHGMRRLVRDAMVTVIAGSLFSDFSSVVSLASAGVVNMEFSREMETEADGYAIRRMKETGLSPARLADALERMEKMHKREAAQESTTKRITQYMSSHPATEDRVARFRAAAR